MGGEPEAAGDALTGAIIGHTLDRASSGPTTGEAGHENALCRNCGAPLQGAFCSACGQPAHLHRSLSSIAHDILHGVFHLEGKIWRTIPELFVHPGRLTRRYIDGERVKFVSPMAMFLFTVFLTFAVVSITGLFGAETLNAGAAPVATKWRSGNQAALDRTNEQIEVLLKRLETAEPDQRAQLEKNLAESESARAVMQALADGNLQALAEIEEQQSARASAAPEGTNGSTSNTWPRPGSRLAAALEQAKNNPQFLLYKLKTNAYKFSWALIPLSVPFLWLLFFWRRDVRLYDHAIFTTYSLSFMMLFFMGLATAASFGAPSVILNTLLVVIPPLHMYAQLRGTYGVSRWGAALRLFFLLIIAVVVLSLFSVLLVVLGLL
jgi:hypothetical protein